MLYFDNIFKIYFCKKIILHKNNGEALSFTLRVETDSGLLTWSQESIVFFIFFHLISKTLKKERNKALRDAGFWLEGL